MSQVFLKNSSHEKKEYLKTCLRRLYLKDIIERYHFRRQKALDEMSILLATCLGELISSSKLATIYKQKTKNRIDGETINNIITAFKDSFILQEAQRYDINGKRIIRTTKKYYYIDNRLKNTRCNFAFQDERADGRKSTLQ